MKTAPSQHFISLQQFLHSDVNRTACLETGLAQSLIRHDVIPLIRIGPDRGVMTDEPGHVLLDRLRQFFLREVGVIEAKIERSSQHGFLIPDAVDEAIGHVADVHEIEIEILLEENQIAVGDRGVLEVVDQQIKPHAG